MFDSYRLRMNALGSYEGESRRRNTQKIMDASWMRDAATKPVYVKWVNSGLPVIDDNDLPVYAKFNVKSYHNITGDAVAYLLQFRLEDIRTNPDIKVGSYVQIMNEMDEPEWWLIVHLDDRTQFRQFSILKCTWTYKWVSKVNGKRIVYECLGAPRKQNSYNSGVWLDYVAQTVENQEVMWLPTNDDTKTILYDTKFLKSSTGRYPPLKWTITKIEDTAVAGISMFTLAQDQFDPSRDNEELMIADYWEGVIDLEIPESEESNAATDLEITYSNTPSVRAGGGYKKFSLNEYVDGDLKEVTSGISWYINNTSVNDSPIAREGVNDVFVVSIGDNQNCFKCLIEENVFKIKCIDYSFIGSKFTITAEANQSSKSIIMEVTSL